MILTRSSSVDARLNLPCAKSTPATELPSGPWQATHLARKNSAPFSMSVGAYADCAGKVPAASAAKKANFIHIPELSPDLFLLTPLLSMPFLSLPPVALD